MPRKSKFNYKKAKKKTIKPRKRKVFKTRKKYKKTKKNGGAQGNSFEKHLKSLDKSQKEAEQAAEDSYNEAFKKATEIVDKKEYAGVWRP